MKDALLIINAEVNGVPRLDVRIEHGRISEIGRSLPRRVPIVDAGGGALIRGLHDHHIHLLALAAAMQSVPVGPNDVTGQEGLKAALRSAPGPGVRATGYHDSVAGPLDRSVLDTLEPTRPVRVQYSTGSLWVLNSKALEEIQPKDGWPEVAERDKAGRPNGRIWRGDAWLGSRSSRQLPALAGVGAMLARCGVTGVTDTSPSTGPEEAAWIGDAVRTGALPVRVTLMSGGPLEPSTDRSFTVGPVKILLDEFALPDFDDLVLRIVLARQWGRRVAFHCVTATELAFAMAALEAAGSLPGDRIEHGSIVPETAIPVLRRLQLTVVTQPGLVLERGERYLRDVDPDEHGDLYRCASLKRAGIPVAGSTDAPYTAADPWPAISAATRRLTRAGNPFGLNEAISPQSAIELFQGDPETPGNPPKPLRVGDPADLCVLKMPLQVSLRVPTAANVAATIKDGQPTYFCDQTEGSMRLASEASNQTA